MIPHKDALSERIHETPELFTSVADIVQLAYGAVANSVASLRSNNDNEGLIRQGFEECRRAILDQLLRAVEPIDPVIPEPPVDDIALRV